MKTKTQKSITLETITTIIEGNKLAAARNILSSSTGATIQITGIISKIAKRDDLLRLVIETITNKCKMTAFANFDSDLEKLKVKELKIKKGKTVSITGSFQSFGSDAVCLGNCKLIK